MNELLTTYSMPDIVVLILVVVIALMAVLWPECQYTECKTCADQLRARRQMDAATRETMRRMREAAIDLDEDDSWRL